MVSLSVSATYFNGYYEWYMACIMMHWYSSDMFWRGTDDVCGCRSARRFLKMIGGPNVKFMGSYSILSSYHATP